jgi:hypothetical protein
MNWVSFFSVIGVAIGIVAWFAAVIWVGVWMEFKFNGNPFGYTAALLLASFVLAVAISVGIAP